MKFIIRPAYITPIVFALFAASRTAVSQATPPPTPEPPASSIDTGYVDYGGGAVSLPLGVGFRIPAYNRVDGLVLPWGPSISLNDGRFNVDPTLTYRSDIGKVDPFVKAQLRVGENGEFEVSGGRATFTNDDWIRSDLVNSAASFFVGSDARNYFRADRGVARYEHRIPRRAFTFTPTVGALTENAWSTGSSVRHTTAPFSVLNRTDSLKMRRTNPSVIRGHTTSALGGVEIEYELEKVAFTFETRVESSFDAPVDNFTQVTFGSKATFPTFGTQTFAFRGHALITPVGDAGPQRFAYLGGAGTLATVDLLALGGDNLLYVEGEYSVPLTRPVLPFAGAPILSARYAAGGARTGSMPDLIQNIGVGVGVRLLKAEYHIDPSYRKTPFSRRSAFSIGVSLTL